tara:strand:- start:2224 stop:2436 length:213 start_codon:yes stop_codon:yes gene_type:complete
MENVKVDIADLKDQRRETVAALWKAVNEQNQWDGIEYRLKRLSELVYVAEKVDLLLFALIKEIEKAGEDV